MKVKVTNVQRFCLKDGPGIRTTVFFKGCNLKCPWCANPENMSFENEKYEDGIFGYDIELEELKKILLKDEAYFKESGGGITFSGGEPLLQFKNIEPLLIDLKNMKINLCVETALNVPKSFVEIAVKYIDEFFVDIKILNIKKAKEILNSNIEQYKENIKVLNSKCNNITFRIPITNEYTATDENLLEIKELIKEYPNFKVEIFKVHNLGESKYKKLGKEFFNYSNVSDEKMKYIYNELKKVATNVEIIEI